MLQRMYLSSLEIATLSAWYCNLCSNILASTSITAGPDQITFFSEKITNKIMLHFPRYHALNNKGRIA